jgi:Holliday junction resolvase RusA-like endonuclease
MIVAFHLHCRPVSLNAKKKNLRYSEQIQAKARSRYDGPLLSHALYSRIIWFHKGPSTGDVDNIAKRIHDALKGVLFLDDGSITHTMTVRVDAAERVELIADPDNPIGAAALVDSLDDASVRDILYIEIGRQSDPKIRLGPLA